MLDPTASFTDEDWDQFMESGMDHEDHDPALQGIDALVAQVEAGVLIIQKLTDRLLAVEGRLAELEDYVGRMVRQDRNPY